MGVLTNLDPAKVFQFFEEICSIPHGSGNVEQISDYLARFAADRGLFCIQDDLKNIVIVKEATPGYEEEPPVILQGHMDMVAVKKPDCDIDMTKEGLRLAVDGDKVYAEGTSLGGDDGIAVAYSLALLDSDTIKHPKLEVIITVDEEVGMDGATGIDLSMITGNRMINLDSEEEGIFLTSCAGGARVKCNITVPAKEMVGPKYTVKVGGLLGGHSGCEIQKERGNSNCLLARILFEAGAGVLSINGGLADNAIPRETVAELVVPREKELAFTTAVREAEKLISAELQSKDPGFCVKMDSDDTDKIYQAGDSREVARFLLSLPNGVQAMSAELPGLVETSLNLGILKYDAQSGKCLAEFSVRSSVESAKKALIDRLLAATELAGGCIEVTGDYPGWKYRKDSPLRDKMIALYEEMYGTLPKVEAIHAGLECGILGSKIKDLDCVSMGPDMRDIHTTEETLSISSTRRVWEYLVALLERK
ncbi:MAG: aminoacyl-histidine dipeptidase [Acetatifactor sp.]|nr:aminoacyl-histidine dipeptidase [Acetatifactor sp.]